ncbi:MULTISPECIES: hypothetical protein [Myxococcus]|uniref:hypothetical protein n=1 Tax=Myxococcus TaxID=32 RepID=UPI00089B18CD|nr:MULTISPECIES: hypothetical protein [Myxococcus]NOJ51126.1 hypothetical protein [Myxococcus xanthus]QPM76912.1 hypothetical protein I5Q59_21365 [Myxococcus xanthus]QVW65979.1 hypothetical protein JTM82_26720 [Myxococcus xanthus DZ2]QZZ52005.1 hypothetical protein MyxoNM_22610 [Myxococcus xanthus]UEO07893.1 hypothetical protein K1515_16075 [Myxococcus xanthus DZ2]
MSVRTIRKYLPIVAVTASAVALLSACGEPLSAEGREVDTGDTVVAFDIPPPTVTGSCFQNESFTRIECSGSASGGVTPYIYQWQMAHNLDANPDPGNFYWRNGSTTFSEPCRYGFFTGGRYYTKYIRFRVLDANGYVSNFIEEPFLCWTPNP